MNKYWLVGNILKESKQINLTFDSKDEAEKMLTFYSLAGYECKLDCVPESVINLANRLQQDYDDRRNIANKIIKESKK